MAETNRRALVIRYLAVVMMMMSLAFAASPAAGRVQTSGMGIGEAGWLLWRHASTAEKKIVITAIVAGIQDSWYDAEDQEQAYIVDVLVAQNDADRLSGISKMRLSAPPPSYLPTYSKSMQYYINALNRVYRVRPNRSYDIAGLLLCFSDKPVRFCQESPTGLRFRSQASAARGAR